MSWIQDAQDLLRTTLAASDSFQSAVGADDATEAAAKIYHDQLPKPESGKSLHTREEMEALRPCAIIYTPDDQGWSIEKDAMHDICWRASGRLMAVIMRNVPDEDKDDLAKVATDFREIAGDIVQDLVGLSQTGGYLAISRVVVSGPFRTEKKEINNIGDAQAIELDITWGLR